MEAMQVVSDNVDDDKVFYQSFIKNLIVNVDSDNFDNAYEAATLIKNKIIGSDRKKLVVLYLNIFPHLINALAKNTDQSFTKIKNEIFYILTSLSKLSVVTSKDEDLIKYFSKEHQRVIVKNLINDNIVSESALICLNAMCNRGLLSFEIFFEEPLSLTLYQIFLNLTSLKHLEYLTNILSHIPKKVIHIHREKLINYNLLDYLSSKLTITISNQIKQNILEFYVKMTSIPSLPTQLWNYILKDDDYSMGAKTHRLLELFDQLQYSDKPFQIQYLAAKCVLNIYENVIASFGKSHLNHVCQFEKLLNNEDVIAQHSTPSIDLLILKRTLPTFVRLLSIYKNEFPPIPGGSVSALKSSYLEIMVASADSLATLVEIHPDLQCIACYTCQLLYCVYDLLNPKICIQLGIDPESKKGKVLKGAIFKLCSALSSNHENIRKRLIESPYNLMDCITKAIILPTAVSIKDPDTENLKFNGIRCMLSFSRSVQLLRTNFLDNTTWKWIVDSIRLYHIDVLAKLVIKSRDDYSGSDDDLTSSLKNLNVLLCIMANLLIEFSPAKENLIGQTNILEMLCEIIKDKIYDNDEDSHYKLIRYNALWAIMNASYKSDKSFKAEICNNLPFNTVLRPILKCLLSPKPDHPDVELATKVLGLLRNLCSGGKNHLNTVLSVLDGESLLEVLSYLINAPLPITDKQQRDFTSSTKENSNQQQQPPPTSTIVLFPNLTAYHKELAICVLINLTMGGEILFDEAGDFSSMTGGSGGGGGAGSQQHLSSVAPSSSGGLSYGPGMTLINEICAGSSTPYANPIRADKHQQPQQQSRTTTSKSQHHDSNLSEFTSPKDYPIYNEEELSIASSDNKNIPGQHPNFNPSTFCGPGGSLNVASSGGEGGASNIERLLMSGGIIPSTPLEGLAYSILHPSLANLAQNLPAMSSMRFMSDMMFMNSLVAPFGGSPGNPPNYPYAAPNTTGLLYPGMAPPISHQSTSAATYLSPTNILRNFLTTKLRYNMALREDILRGLISCLFQSKTQCSTTDNDEDEETLDNITTVKMSSKNTTTHVSQQITEKNDGGNKGGGRNEDDNNGSSSTTAMDLRKNIPSFTTSSSSYTALMGEVGNEQTTVQPIHMGQPLLEAPAPNTPLTAEAGNTISGLTSQENSNLDLISVVGCVEEETGGEEEGEVVEGDDDDEMMLGNKDGEKLNVPGGSCSKERLLTTPISASNIRGSGGKVVDDLAMTSGVSYTVSILARLNKNSTMMTTTGTDTSTTNNMEVATAVATEPAVNQQRTSYQDENLMKCFPLNNLQRSAARCLNLIYANKNIARIDSVSDYIPFPLNTLTREYTLNSGANAEEASSNGRVSIKAFYWRILYNVLKSTPKPVLQNFHYSNTNSTLSSSMESSKNAKDKFLALKSFIKMLKRQSNIVEDERDFNVAEDASMSSITNEKLNFNENSKVPFLTDIKIVKTETSQKQTNNTPLENINEGILRNSSSGMATEYAHPSSLASSSVFVRHQPNSNDILIDTNRENIKNIIPAFVNWLKEESKNNKRRAAASKSNTSNPSTTSAKNPN